MRLAWIYSDWLSAAPSIGGDEYLRPTGVLPWPFLNGKFDDEPTHNALVVVIGPWWATPCVRHADFRRWARWMREGNRYEIDTDEWERWAKSEPPQPACFDNHLEAS